MIDQVWPKNSAALDNPVWSALGGPHRSRAGRLPDLAWYPPSIAPFAAIPDAGILPDLEAARTQGLGDSVYFVGACPKSLPPGWRVVSNSNVLQLFPAGERMALPSLQEISGVRTHPGYGGRGHARNVVRIELQTHSTIAPFEYGLRVRQRVDQVIGHIVRIQRFDQHLDAVRTENRGCEQKIVHVGVAAKLAFIGRGASAGEHMNQRRAQRLRVSAAIRAARSSCCRPRLAARS